MALLQYEQVGPLPPDGFKMSGGFRIWGGADLSRAHASSLPSHLCSPHPQPPTHQALNLGAYPHPPTPNPPGAKPAQGAHPAVRRATAASSPRRPPGLRGQIPRGLRGQDDTGRGGRAPDTGGGHGAGRDARGWLGGRHLARKTAECATGHTRAAA
eukprot:scaffold6999_cov96-Isochrysis_galbana.AAC.1